MIDQLPAEIIVQILRYLPTITSIVNVSKINRKLHQIVEESSESIYQNFVTRSFPSIPAHPPWQKAAFNLTSRSRAFERRAFIARECAAPDDAVRPGPNERRRHVGCPPVIDSYETASTNAEGGKEVLAWGLAGRLRLRTIENNSVFWSSFRLPDDHEHWTDIHDLRLLRPHQKRNVYGESIIIQRWHEVTLVHSSPAVDKFVVANKYQPDRVNAVQCIDVSDGIDPKLAVCNARFLQLFPVHSRQNQTSPDMVLEFIHSPLKQRKRCVKFLAENRIAVSMQYLEGKKPAPIQIYDLETAQPSLRLQPVQQFLTTDQQMLNNANVMVKLNDNNIASTFSENLLLAGCADGLVRLYDLRSGPKSISTYSDPVDDGQILSLIAVGQEKFFAGSHQNACLKMFDMRMGAKTYHHVTARPPPSVGNAFRRSNQPASSVTNPLSPRREINIFLSVSVYHSQQLWRPLPRVDNGRLHRYRGAIYSLSSPSSSSRTFYAGIENHVLQLDFVNTDDCSLNRGGIRNSLDNRRVFNLSCYERPRKLFETTDAALLRTQRDWNKSVSRLCDGESGWDERWQMGSFQRRLQHQAARRDS